MIAQTLTAGLAKEAQGATAASAPATITLAVDNMRCGGCLRSVERAALRIPG